MTLLIPIKTETMKQETVTESVLPNILVSVRKMLHRQERKRKELVLHSLFQYPVRASYWPCPARHEMAISQVMICRVSVEQIESGREAEIWWSK